jgi:hypothetical protein
MEKNHDFVQIKVDGKTKSRSYEVQKAFKIRVDENKTVIVYNRINNYILDAILNAVFSHDA